MFESVHERRRKAPLHYWAKAENARLSAFYLFEAATNAAGDSESDAIGYGGTPRIAFHEGFRREAAIALELILKATIAQRIESALFLGESPPLKEVRMTHDVVKHWQDADLPTLSKADQRVLLVIKQILYWSGRYAAPKRDRDFDMEEEQDRLLRPKPTGKLNITVLVDVDWTTFDRLYVEASNKFNSLRSCLPH